MIAKWTMASLATADATAAVRERAIGGVRSRGSGSCSASARVTAALPATEARLGIMRSAQVIICRAALRLAAVKPITEADERAELARASKAIGAAFRLHQRYSQAARCV